MGKKVYGYGIKGTKEFKINMAVAEYKENIPNVSDKQIEFAKNLANKIFNLEMDGKIEVNHNRCGMGKSTIIKAVLNQLVNNYGFWGEVPREAQLDNYGHGAIVITDRLERLEEIENYNGLHDRCYLMKYNKEDEGQLYKNNRKEFLKQLNEQYRYPIVLLSTQKYFKMKECERELLYKWKDGQRKILICDEKPPIISTEIIDEKYLSNIRIELEALPKGEDRAYLISYWKRFYNWLDGVRDSYTEYNINWVCGSGNDCLLSHATDKKFFNKLSELAPTRLYDSIYKLKDINKNGCLFISNGDKTQDNSRKFILIKNNTNKFDKDKCKTVIFDATAMYDKHYTISDTYNIFKLDDSKENDINLHHIPISTSQNYLKTNIKHLENICNYINTLGNDLFIATYGKKSGLFQQFKMRINSKEIAYFGDIKGKNNWNSYSDMVHLGLNRKSNDVYLATYIALTGAEEKWNVVQDTDKIYSDIEKILENSKGRFKNETMQLIMESDLVIDTIQNIMRIKCRHFNNKDICNVFLLCSNNYNAVVKKIEKVTGAKRKEYLPNIFAEAKTMDRKAMNGKEMTNPQKIMKYIDSLEKGVIIRTKDIYEHTGLSTKEFNKARENKIVSDWFANNTIKKGTYKIC
ncbi:hypothetical protein [Clostridium nigeriense]|uniref:hypothetical protein n=1 Tax=Clostridium nigeriense TaxID=1805470 RepID=UPI00135664C6|nr:hypothetical protein [Clostridium nigeriense]